MTHDVARCLPKDLQLSIITITITMTMTMTITITIYRDHDIYIYIYIYITNRFHVAVRLFSNRSQMTSKCGKNKKVAHEARIKADGDVNRACPKKTLSNRYCTLFETYLTNSWETNCIANLASYEAILIIRW